MKYLNFLKQLRNTLANISSLDISTGALFIVRPCSSDLYNIIVARYHTKGFEAGTEDKCISRTPGWYLFRT